MKDANLYYKIIFIILLAFFAGNFVYPKYFNYAADVVKLPHFPDKPFKLGLDLQGGIHLVYEADLEQIDLRDRGSTMEGLRDIIERRVNIFGVKEPTVQIQQERLIIELAGIKEVSEAVEMIGKTPYLEFREPRPEEETERILDKIREVEETEPDKISEIEGLEIAFEDPYFQPGQLTGKYLKGAQITFDPTTQEPIVSLEFNEEGAKIFQELTEKYIGKPLGIYIDYELISAPTVQEPISGGRAQITGKFTILEARELVKNLNAGALPIPIKLLSQQTVGPTLGKISLEQSLKAGLIGFLLVLLFMLLFYRVPGILAAISLLIYIGLLLSLCKLIPITLTLAGIAGCILSMGMAIDANILIFSRIREELAEGRNYFTALEEGSKRAWPAIRDGNFTTILVGLILFSFGTSFVQGFALTLVMGNIIGMFTAIFITNNLLRVFVSEKLPKWLWFRC